MSDQESEFNPYQDDVAGSETAASETAASEHAKFDTSKSSGALPAAPKSQHRRWTPPIWVWCSFGLWCTLLVVVRMANVTGDHAIVNVMTLIFGFLAFSALATWFSFMSAYPAFLRWGLMAAVVGSVATFCAMYRVHQVSGELVPTFRLRFAAAPDELLKPLPATGGKEISVNSATPDDFPEFLGPGRRARVDHIGLASDWIAFPPQQLWRRPIGAGWGGFAVVNGAAFTMEQRGEQELVTCYEIESGDLVWSFGMEGRHATLMGGVGPRSTPTIDGGRVYAQGAFGTVLCLDGASGSEIWRDDLLSRYGIPHDDDVNAIAWGRSGSPLIVDDLVIVPAGGPLNGPYVSLIAYEKNTGDVAWESGDHQISYASPVLATLAGKRQILIVNEDTASGHDPRSGRRLWQVEWPGKSNANASVSQAVPVPPDQFMLSKGYGGGASLFQLSAAGSGAFEVQTVWQSSRVLKTKFCNVVVHQDYAYGLSDGILECVELLTGQRAWKGARYGHGQILGVSDCLLVQMEDGNVALVDATPAGFRELSRFPALDGKTWNNPTLYGNRLLVRNGEEAACYALATE